MLETHAFIINALIFLFFSKLTFGILSYSDKLVLIRNSGFLSECNSFNWIVRIQNINEIVDGLFFKFLRFKELFITLLYQFYIIL